MQPGPTRTQASPVVEKEATFPKGIHNMIVALANPTIWTCRDKLQTVCVLNGLDVMPQPHFNPWIRFYSGPHSLCERNWINGNLRRIKRGEGRSRMPGSLSSALASG